jgi:hypothetical protein
VSSRLTRLTASGWPETVCVFARTHCTRHAMVTLMTIQRQSLVPDDAHWPEQVSRILATLGFALIEPDRGRGDEVAHLVVALRAQPTLQHFDPETIDYWMTDGARGRAAKLDRETRFPVGSDFAWGRISLTDRLDVKNEFLSFGGTMRAQLAADNAVLVDFSSNAPIMRWAGHSQSPDPLAAEVGSFFARIKVPIDFVPGAEALVAKAAPRTLYCSFIQFVRERLSRTPRLGEANLVLADWTTREAQRLETGATEQWKAALELRRGLGAVDAIPVE